MIHNSKEFKPNKITLLTILFASMMILMGAAAVAPALEPISKHFTDASAYVVSLVVTLPALGVAVTGFGVGYLADRFGKAKVFLVSVVIFTLAGVSGYLLNTLESILIGRFILGVGIAGISLCTTALIAEYYDGMSRGKVIGYQSAAMGIGVLFLETIGGSLADIGWQEPFLIYLIGIPILILGLVSIREPVKRSISDNVETDMPVPKIEHLGRKIIVCYLMIFFAMFLMFILPTNLPYYMSESGESLTICGLMLGVLGVSQAVFSILYARSFNKLGDTVAYGVSFLSIGLGYCLLNMSGLPFIVIAMVLIGIGMGLITLTVIGRLTFYSQSGGSGKIMGGYSMAFNLGTFCSSLVMTPVISAIAVYTTSFFYVGLFAIVLAAVCLVFTIPAILSKDSDKRKEKDTRSDVDDPSVNSVKAFENILVATDGSEPSINASDMAITLAKNNNAKLTVVFVFDADQYSTISSSMPSADEVKKLGITVSDAALKTVVDRAKERGVNVQSLVLYGHPAETIAEESKNHDLVVCGSIGRTNISRVLMGSVAEKVARLASCPVLICRK